jgi:hypothetical protein
MLLVLLPLLSCNTCSNDTILKLPSPDGLLVATAYERNCGATTDFSSIVNVQPAHDGFNPGESIVFVAEGKYALHLAWTKPRELQITCIGCIRKHIFREVSALGDIDVTYKLEPTPTP